MQERYNGKYCWSLRARGHASWCYLKVVQAGERGSWLWDSDQRAVVIFTNAPDNFGTAVAPGMEVLVAQVVDMFRLNPFNTTFLEYTPPASLLPEYEALPDEDPMQELERLTSSAFGSTEGKYEHITFARWQKRESTDGPRYEAIGPGWTQIGQREVAHMIAELDERSA